MHYGYASKITSLIINWQKQYGRHDLPWPKNPTLYRVWLSEVMLQQAQVTTTIDYFNRFAQRFNSLSSLAAAHIDEVLYLWSGLGCYSRARNLHKTARIIEHNHQGKFPQALDELIKLPGIGRSTAAAILSQAMQQPQAILNGSVKRVISRLYAISEPLNLYSTEKSLWGLSETLTATVQKADTVNYIQGIIDLGATICKKPKPDCLDCPLKQHCQAFSQNIQTQLPIKQKQLNKPIKMANYAMTYYQQHILLKQRPAKGIWGGLWSFPDRQEFLKTQFSFGWLEETKKISFQQTFSHFHLYTIISVYQADTISKLPKNWLWYNCIRPVEIDLAAPIKKLLNKQLTKQRLNLQPQTNLYNLN